jgi:4-amino-4-deoxy-L-arabinose transferase-like glycosyltransferase
MNKKMNNQTFNKFGLWALWIVSGLIWITEGSVVFMILPLWYTTRRNKQIQGINT